MNYLLSECWAKLTICFHAAYLFWRVATDSSPKSFLIMPSTGVCGLLALPYEKPSSGILLTFWWSLVVMRASFSFLKAWFAWQRKIHVKSNRNDNGWRRITVRFFEELVALLTLASEAFSLRHILLSFMKSLGSCAFLCEASWNYQCWVTVHIQTDHQSYRNQFKHNLIHDFRVKWTVI